MMGNPLATTTGIEVRAMVGLKRNAEMAMPPPLLT
jgi:hypothetical protein